MTDGMGPVEGGLDKAKNKAAGAAVTAMTGGNAAAGKVAENVASKVSPRRTIKIIVASLVAFAAAVCAGVLMVFSMFSTNSNSISAYIASQEDCGEILASATGGTDTSSMEETARVIYSVARAMGMSENNIAGMLGNFQVESEIDPTVVETIYTEPYEFGARKQAAEAEDYLADRVAPDYGARFPLIKRLGIGLGQWTDTNDGASGNSQLRSFASSVNRPWYTVETQLAFMLSDTDEKSATLKAFIATPHPSPQEAALWWAANWEGNTTMHQSERLKYAGEWKAKFDSSWTANDQLMNSLLVLAGSGPTTGPPAPNFEAIQPTQCSAGTTQSADLSTLLEFIGQTIENPEITYEWGGKGPKTYDCSGWVSAAFKTIGINITPQTMSMITELPSMGTQIDSKDVRKWQPGDILVWREHTGIYIGNGTMAHFSTPGQPGKYVQIKDYYRWVQNQDLWVFRVITDSGGPISSGAWGPPLRTVPAVSSPFGYRTHPVFGTAKLHEGVDLPMPAGTPIYAASGGRVTISSFDTGCGNMVRIDHGGGVSTQYCHMINPASVKVGQSVKTGQQLGGVGTTGASTGNHLHFGVLKNGKYIDPVPFMKSKKVAGF